MEAGDECVEDCGFKPEGSRSLLPSKFVARNFASESELLGLSSFRPVEPGDHLSNDIGVYQHVHGLCLRIR